MTTIFYIFAILACMAVSSKAFILTGNRLLTKGLSCSSSNIINEKIKKDEPKVVEVVVSADPNPNPNPNP